jgi:hypothetical protein
MGAGGSLQLRIWWEKVAEGRGEGRASRSFGYAQDDGEKQATASAGELRYGFEV